MSPPSAARHAPVRRLAQRVPPANLSDRPPPAHVHAQAQADAAALRPAAAPARSAPAVANHSFALRAVPTGPVDTPQSPAPAPKPSDIDLGFNALDISHRLIESIDQSQVRIENDPADDSRLFKRQRVVRHVDFPAALAALTDLTAPEVAAVEARYQDYEHRPLQHDLFGGAKNPIRTDLTVDQIYRLKALLKGTKASSAEDAEAAARHRLEGDVAELRALLKGKRGAPEVARVMTLLRRPAAEAEALIHEYNLNHDLQTDLLRLGMPQSLRAMMLLSGSSIAADGYAVGLARHRIVAIDATLAEMQPAATTARSLLVSLGQAAAPTVAVQRRQTIAALKAERRVQVQQIQERIEQAAAEAREQALSEGADLMDADAAVRRRVAMVLGPEGATEAAVGGAGAQLIRATADSRAPEMAAARLRLLDESGQLRSDQIADALRELRQQAALEVQQMWPEAAGDVLDREEQALADRWFMRLRDTWNATVQGDGPGFSELLDRGKQTEVDVKRGLYMAAGRLSDVEELVLALAGDRKDLETAKRVLRGKTADRIAELRVAYQRRTRNPVAWPLGRSLDFDLFGAAPTRAGQSNPFDRFGRRVLAQGKAEGSDRLLLEDYLQRPSREGGIEEVNYIAARAEREYEYTIANRGATGWWRDKWGNEARSLLNATIREVRTLRGDYIALTRGARDPLALGAGPAHDIVHRLRLARATIRGDRAGYEKATAALRATFQAVASFVLQAVLTAVLAPLAGMLFAARLAHAGATMVRFAAWTRNTAVGMASTIGANKAVYGNSYDTAMLLRDLRGGLAGPLGASGAGKLLGPVAQGLTRRLGKTMGGEVIAGAQTLGAMQATALIEGEDADIFNNFLEQHFLGKVGDVITRQTAKVPTPRRGARQGEALRRANAEATTHPAGAEAAPSQRRDGTDPVDAAAPEVLAPVPMALPEPRPRAVPKSQRQTQRGMAVAGPHDTAPTPAATPIGAVLQAADPHHLVQGYKLYEAQMAADPAREVALVYNLALDQWAVVQGGPGSVPMDGLQRLGWRAEDTSLARHSHPVAAGGETPAPQRLPSGQGADLEIVRGDALKGEAPQTQIHVIDVHTARGRDRTFVVYNPGTKRWTIDHPHEPARGGRARTSFATYAQYHDWFRRQYGFDPGVAKAAGARAPGRPLPPAPVPRVGVGPPHGWNHVPMTHQRLPRDSQGNIAPLPHGVVYVFGDGTRVWSQGGAIRHDTVLGAGRGRQGFEKELFSAGESGRPDLAGLQRAHALGQGTGFESPFGIYYAPAEVNQILQNNRLEEMFRGLAEVALPHEKFHLSTLTAAHPDSLRLKEVRYRVEVSQHGGTPALLFEYVIRVGNNPPNPTVEHEVADITTVADEYFTLVDVPQRVVDRFKGRRVQADAPRAAAANLALVTPLVGQPVATTALPSGYNKFMRSDGRWVIRREVAKDADVQALTVRSNVDGVQVIELR